MLPQPFSGGCPAPPINIFGVCFVLLLSVKRKEFLDEFVCLSVFDCMRGGMGSFVLKGTLTWGWIVNPREELFCLFACLLV